MLTLVQQGKASLYISGLTLAEVWKDHPQYGDNLQLPSGAGDAFERFIHQYVTVLNVTGNVGITARNLLKEQPVLSKVGVRDAIHLASCIFYNIPVLHTFDEDLMSLSNKLERSDGKMLVICKPQMLGRQLDIKDQL